jgi:DNA-binding GntR family transcriptional regulator
MASIKTDTAYEAIKSKILEGELAPLTDINEEALQKELNLSRTPIREACQRLKKEGFLYVYPSKGTIVAEITSDLIREIFQVRLLNEPFITAQACRARMDRGWLLAKREAFANPPPGLSEEETRRYYIQLDRELHLNLLKTCTNRFLVSTMSVVLDHNHRIRIKVSHPNTDSDGSILEHISIIDALLKGDEAAAEQSMRHHIEESKRISYGFYG